MYRFKTYPYRYNSKSPQLSFANVDHRSLTSSPVPRTQHWQTSSIPVPKPRFQSPSPSPISKSPLPPVPNTPATPGMTKYKVNLLSNSLSGFKTPPPPKVVASPEILQRKLKS
ncbi:hypothetical protein P9112_009144 [Eukaryota sp. TZLM1-RC]